MSALLRICPSLRQCAMPTTFRPVSTTLVAGRRITYNPHRSLYLHFTAKAEDSEGYTPLHTETLKIATTPDYDQFMFDRYLRERADPNTQTYRGYTPLHTLTMLSGGTELMRADAFHYLLRCGANPNATDRDRMAPLHHVAKQTDWGSSYFSESHRAVMVMQLLHAGANPNLPDRDLMTPLHHLLMHGTVDKIHSLLTMMLMKGADPHKRNRFNQDAYALATDSRTKDLMGRLSIEYQRMHGK